jgi:hypothetical protein
MKQLDSAKFVANHWTLMHTPGHQQNISHVISTLRVNPSEFPAHFCFLTGKHSKRVESSQKLLNDNFFSADPTVLPSDAEPGVEGAVIKLTPGAVITNYGSAPALAPQHWILLLRLGDAG